MVAGGRAHGLELIKHITWGRFAGVLGGGSGRCRALSRELRFLRFKDRFVVMAESVLNKYVLFPCSGEEQSF